MDSSPFPPVKYFFLAENWHVTRVWEMGGLWNENVWRRPPQIERLDLAIVEQEDTFWLYQVEDAVLMVEICPDRGAGDPTSAIGQVLLKRLMSANGVLERLQSAEKILNKSPDRSPSA